MAKSDFKTWHKSTIMWKASWGLSHWEIQDNPTTLNIALDDVKEAILAIEWNSFHLLRKKVDYLHLVFNTCQMPFWLSNYLFIYFILALHKNVLCKISTLHNEGLSKDCMSQNIVAVICK